MSPELTKDTNLEILNPRGFYPVRTVANFLGLSPDTIYNMIKSGAIESETKLIDNRKGGPNEVDHITPASVLNARETWFTRLALMEPDESDDLILSTREISEKVGMSRSQLNRLIADEKVRGERNKFGRLFTSINDLRDYAETVEFNDQRPTRGYKKTNSLL